MAFEWDLKPTWLRNSSKVVCGRVMIFLPDFGFGESCLSSLSSRVAVVNSTKPDCTSVVHTTATEEIVNLKTHATGRFTAREKKTHNQGHPAPQSVAWRPESELNELQTPGTAERSQARNNKTITHAKHDAQKQKESLHKCLQSTGLCLSITAGWKELISMPILMTYTFGAPLVFL